MSQLAFDLRAIDLRARREAGIDRAYIAAGDDFKACAYTYLCQFARNHGEPFIGEDVSDAYEAAGLPKPHDLRAWGALYRKAVSEHVVERLDCEGWSKRRASPTYRYRSLCARVAA